MFAVADLRGLEDSLLNLSSLVDEAILHCDLSSLASHTHVVALRGELVEFSSVVGLYRTLKREILSLPTPRSVLLSFIPHFTPASLVHLLDAAHQTEATLRHLVDSFASIPQAYSSTSSKQTILDTEPQASLVQHEALSRHVQILDRTFRAALLLHLRHLYGANQLSSQTVITPADVRAPHEHFLSSLRVYPFSIHSNGLSQVPLSDWCAFIASDSSLDALMSDINAAAQEWVVLALNSKSRDEVRAMVSQFMWSGPLGTVGATLARIGDQLAGEYGGSPHSASFTNNLHYTLHCSSLPTHVVVPYGSSGCGKTTVINALIGDSVLPPYGLPTVVPCRIRHQEGLVAPHLIVPNTLFQIAVDCLRGIRFHQRKDKYQAREGAPADTDIKQLIKGCRRLDKKILAFFEKLDREGYSVPPSVQGVSTVRNLLQELNHIATICHHLGVPFNIPRLEWPIIYVDFHWLRSDDWEFWDLPGDPEALDLFDEHLRRALEINACLLPIVNSNQQMINLAWTSLPRRLLQMNAVVPCVIGTHVRPTRHNENEHFLQDLGREFYPSTEEPPIFICDTRVGSMAAGFLLRLRMFESKPSLDTLMSDRAALGYFFIKDMGLDVDDEDGYEARSYSSLERSALKKLEDSHLNPTLEKAIQAIEHSTKASQVQRSQRLIEGGFTLEAEITSLIGQVAGAITNLESTSAASLPLSLEIKRIQELNAQQISQFIQVHFERFADEFGSAVRTSIRKVFPEPTGAPSQMTTVLSPQALSQLEDSVLAQIRAISATLIDRLLLDIHDLTNFLSAREAPMLEQLGRQSPVLTLESLDQRLQDKWEGLSTCHTPVPPGGLRSCCTTIRILPAPMSVFREFRSQLSWGAGHSRIARYITALLAAIPFLVRWSYLLFTARRHYRISVSEVEAFYHDHVTTPWLLETEAFVRRSFDRALQRPLEYLETVTAMNDVALRVKQENLMELLSLKGNLHAAVGALRFLSE